MVPIDERIRQFRLKIEEYSEQRTVSLSLGFYLKKTGKCQVEFEPPVQTKKGTEGYPDLVMVFGTGDIVADVKYIRSDNVSTYQGRVDELTKYSGKLTMNNQEIYPDLVALCPQPLVASSLPPSEVVCVIGYNIEDGNVILRPVKNPPDNQEFNKLFSGDSLSVPMHSGTEQFLRKEPVFAYTAHQVYRIMWAVSVEDPKDASVRRIDITALKGALRSIYPAYLKDSSGNPQPQIADGRLTKSLTFLERHQWVERKGDVIEISTAKGTRVADTLSKFIEFQAKDEFRRKRPAQPIEAEAPTLEPFFFDAEKEGA